MVGATGRLGGCLARAGLAAGHPTFALVRPHHFACPGSPAIEPLVAAGATLLQVNADVITTFLVRCATAQVNVIYLFTVLKAALWFRGR